MRFEIEIGATLRTITVEPQGGMFKVTVDGRAHLVDVRRIDGDTLSLLVQGNAQPLPARSVEAALVPAGTAGEFDVHVAGYQLPVRLRNGLRGRTALPAAASGQGPQRVVSPMPGKVVRVLVKPGAAVHARQGLIVVEAMKMENELRAARDGRVGEVAVSEGQSVEAGTVLLVVE
jgi:biotin carboxyl carrier protein